MEQADWAQKYRPTQFSELVLPTGLSKKIGAYMQDKGGMSLMFYGKPGSGKTSVAKLINPGTTIFINCTIENSISMVRELERSCSKVTFSGDRRIVVLDEADYLTKDAQVALRGLVERYSSNNCFIMTANDPERLSDAIQSRFLPIAFDFMASSEFKQALLERLKVIAASEGRVDAQEVHLRLIINQCFPDIRKMIKKLQYELMDCAEMG